MSAPTMSLSMMEFDDQSFADGSAFDGELAIAAFAMPVLIDAALSLPLVAPADEVPLLLPTVDARAPRRIAG